MKNYKQLTEDVRRRLNPDSIPIQKAFSEELSSISYSDALLFIRTAMKGVEDTYTQKSIEAGERVKTHLDRELSDKVFKYQGSVMTNTHIKGHSDIDLLVISDKFYSYDSNRINEILNNNVEKTKFFTESINKLESEKSRSSYSGNSLEDLKNLRIDSEKVLADKYKICDVKKPKAIKIKNLDLNREVDIVISNWYDDVTSIINDKGEYRGIQVYDKEEHRKGKADFPFLSIKRINSKSSDTNGRLKKMIRFLKNIKALSTYNIDLSSFDINAICYDLNASKYNDKKFYELVPVLYSHLNSIVVDKTHSDKIVSVDGREYIFRFKPGKLDNLKLLMNELNGILNDLKQVPIYG